ncbi:MULTISPECIES: protein YhfH [Alkalihalophilus]|jgi:DNA-directed RNA polymerase subunit RPC12/RpoP|uniref:YhfH family protein n=3 Tax=Alkalihalophilus TaxID=2893060 RepID=D3FXV2_ALKPO|nr:MULTISPECIES: protein YhfH [Alkalihalophilus]ADC48939.1 hypothetical protein BpOF4_04375 [Alkalihalophilus pseudofirmus OF4]ERN52161.1 hypothetical protein A33I_16765 [Alkalihalophilus marmarensis DSM 21297]MDV2886074.1 protein YhfH [Alkalihalophilus pseudofirmus]MEC2071873.1 protein YhfH [Alkalihalophilus marmarensis]MED1600126.1 protein YhfH [Alkalihalophilus marmarensis]
MTYKAMITRRTGMKECTDCGKVINQIQEAYFNQCEKCLRHANHD